ncbi:MAG TPA: hypothetical protein VFK96_02570 [Gammaproteobacteria bacterium]|nr:hypothetical protein [Gammaproteobacteria bacterium]
MRRSQTAKAVIAYVVVSIAATVLAGIAGCIPVASTFYKATAPIGHSEAYICGGAIHHNDALALTRGDIKLLVHAFAEQPPVNGFVNATILALVPRKDVVKLDVQKVKVVSDSGKVIGRYKKTTVRDWGKGGAAAVKKLSTPIKSLTGTRYTSMERPLAWYNIWLDVKVPLPTIFYIKVPKMEINGIKYQAFRVKFTKTHATYLKPINGC